MPFRWSLLVLLLLLLISLLTLSRIARTSAGDGLTSRGKTSSLLLHHLQEEEHLRSRSAQIRLDLEENDLQLEFDCTLPSSATESSSPSLSREEKLLQEADFELELSLEIQRLIQRHQYDSTNLNESPSELQRHLERKLRNQKRRMSAYRASLRHQAALSYASQECVAWRAKQQQLETQQRDRYSSSFIHAKTQKPLSSANALERFKQFHPNRQDLDSDSIFADTLNALANKQYTDANSFVIELDPTKIMAGSRRASAYQNDDIHVLVLDMQWDPEVTVVVGNVLDETVKLRQEGYRPVMLNVDYHLDSATNNEADLFRRTTLYQCLDQEPRRSRFYPLQENGGVYCPNQAVFRHGQDRDNEFMDRFEWISVVSVAPIPELETREKDGGLGGVQFLEGEDDLLRRKILAAMKIGVSQGHDALVLPPHGTDVGQNPAEAIAAIYRSIIGRDFMGGRKRFQTYKKIVMVLDPEQADKIVNETSSYRPLLPVTTVTATPLPGQGQGLSSDEPRPEDSSQEEIQPLEKRFTNADELDQESFISKDQEYDNEMKDKETVKSQDDNEAEDKDTFEASEQVSEDVSQDGDETEEANSTEDGEFIEEEVGNNEEPPADQLVTEDEVSESEALLEEQDLEEDADISDEAMEEDLSDIPQILKADSIPTKDDSSEYEKGEAEESSSAIVASSENEVSNGDAQDEQTDKQTEEEYVQITETVREVFERMLEQRSLLIVKNRARGLLGPEEPDNSKVSSNTTSNVNSTESIPSSSIVSAPVPTA
ncbi:hypothetical protein BGX21_006937 [Mortierella sp. AD011]|nr:hypothetical protein BGX20_009401 [Mortierella sp. AD010]KAF9398998.1 hypothetical protein BGX21_006937 [Mortierella sp. AD011]